jgi:hypothetical protein
MSSTPKIAVITAASIGMVLTQSSPLLAEKQDSSAPENVTKIAAPIDLDEEVLYSARPDEVLALLWQIYSCCFSSLIQDRQYGHR